MSLRVLLAAAILAASLAGAVWLHAPSTRLTDAVVRNCGETALGRTCSTTQAKVRGNWQDPAAIALAVLGLGVAAAILVPMFSMRRARR